MIDTSYTTSRAQAIHFAHEIRAVAKSLTPEQITTLPLPAWTHFLAVVTEASAFLVNEGELPSAFAQSIKTAVQKDLAKA